MRWVALGALVTGLLLTAIVHARAGDEVALCDDVPGTRCAVGSGASWIWTGFVLTGPLVLVAGIAWTRHLHETGRLGPFATAPIPDWEELLEGISVVVVALLTFLIIRNGPKIALVDYGWPNSWLDGRLGDVRGAPLLPSRRSWFLVGVLVSAPFTFSLGAALGREWYAWRRHRNPDGDDLSGASSAPR